MVNEKNYFLLLGRLYTDRIRMQLRALLLIQKTVRRFVRGVWARTMLFHALLYQSACNIQVSKVEKRSENKTRQDRRGHDMRENENKSKQKQKNRTK